MLLSAATLATQGPQGGWRWDGGELNWHTYLPGSVSKLLLPANAGRPYTGSSAPLWHVSFDVQAARGQNQPQSGDRHHTCQTQAG